MTGEIDQLIRLIPKLFRNNFKTTSFEEFLDKFITHKSIINLRVSILIFAITVCSCGTYRQNIMFKTTETSEIAVIGAEHTDINRYQIQPFDLLEIEVYTQKGELLIDPELKMQNQNFNRSQDNRKISYTVNKDGEVLLPMIGGVNLTGKTLAEAELFLVSHYSKYYKEPYIKLNFINKRVIVLGAYGNQVIPLNNENTNVAEVLALVEGMEVRAKVNNIKLLRGSQSFVIDFSTLDAFHENNMSVKPGDIIYIEPIQRPFTEFMRDNGAVISVLSSALSLIVLIISLN